MSNVFGKAKFGGNKRTWFKLKDGESVYRILPPMGELQEDGRWSAFYRIHYGYKNSANQMRTFQSPLIRNMKTKLVDVPDAALERIEQLTAKLDEAKKANNQELVAQLLKLVGGQKSRYNLDSNHYMNVIDLQGNIGILKIRHKAKLALDLAIKKLRDEGVDGGGLDSENGRFFVFSRGGTGRDTLYQVSVYEKKINVDGVGEVKQAVVHTITDDIAKRCVVLNKDGNFQYKEAANLLTLFKKPTSEEVERIVKEGEKAVDEILDAKATTADDTADDDGGPEDDDASTTEAKNAAKGGVTNVTAPANTGSNQANTETTLAVQAGTTRANSSGGTTTLNPTTTPNTTQAKTTTPTAPQTTAESVNTQTDEEFLKSIGL